MRKLRQINDALPGLTGGIFLYGALLQIVASALGSGRLYDAVGLWQALAALSIWEFTWRLHCGVFWEKTAGRAGAGADSRRGWFCATRWCSVCSRCFWFSVSEIPF